MVSCLANVLYHLKEGMHIISLHTFNTDIHTGKEISRPITLGQQLPTLVQFCFTCRIPPTLLHPSIILKPVSNIILIHLEPLYF